MANELQITLSSTFTNGSLKDTIASATLNVTQTTQGFHGPCVSVGTSEEDFDDGDVATLGWIYMKNVDSSNYVQWGPKSAGAMVAMGRLKAGEWAIFRMEPGITLRWVANTAAVKVQVKLYEA